MNKNQTQGNWKQFKGKLKEKWGDLTDDELDRFEGQRDQLAGRIQEKYGDSQEDVDRVLRDAERDAQYHY